VFKLLAKATMGQISGGLRPKAMMHRAEPAATGARHDR
jgi:hypothetical protein